MSEHVLPTVFPKEVFSVKEMAEYLGISESVVRRLVKESRIPFVMIETRILFFLPVIRQWLVSISTEAVVNDNSMQQRAHVKTNMIWNNAREV